MEAYPTLKIADARKKAEEMRGEILKGLDPSEKKPEIMKKPSFEKTAHEFFSSQVWSDSHRETVIARMRYIPKSMKETPLEEISPRQIMEQVLRPLEASGKLETAKRVRIIMSQVFRYGIAMGDTFTDPARDLQSALRPAVKKPRAAIIDMDDFKDLWIAICGYPQKTLKCAMQLSALSFQRPFNIRCAEWSEFDLEKRMWTIPAEKMKIMMGCSDMVSAAWLPRKAPARRNLKGAPHETSNRPRASDTPIFIAAVKYPHVDRQTAS